MLFRSSIQGIELEVRAIPLEGFEIAAGLGLLDAEFTNYINPFTGDRFDGNTIPYSPTLTYNLGVQYRHPIGVFGRIELQGSGRTYFDDTNQLAQDPFITINARIGYETENYGIYLFGNNIFNSHYLTQAYTIFIGDIGTYAAPATYGVQVRANF